ncbi:penicillin-binding protein 1C [Helicobacter sp. MIT 05-5293]|uniref:penicillin-binding protein 1C n=1 Tax=Helicobacter sp. MIT 05-5293 TaxID=1548149 RepID=UPI00068A518F|nr:penicillin-binding protein 1C [Helicobacter sp. MIT 05-5293]
MLLIIASIGLCVLCYGAFVFLNFYVRHSAQDDLFESTYSKSVFDKDNQLLSVFLDSNEQWHLKSPTQVPKKLEIAALTYEDKRFFNHYGIDILALLRSFKDNLISSKRYGASTITMQVIKLYFHQKRNYKNKFDEFFQALALESIYSKEQILKMYLDNAPYGGNIIGFHSASLLYFGKDSAHLSWGEAALLAVLPNAPGLLNLNKNSSLLKDKRDALLHKLHQQGHIDKDLLSLALLEPLPTHKLTHHNIAPHLSLKVIAQTPNLSNIQTTLNKKIQMRLESKIKQYHKKLLPQGILNMSALVLDTSNGEVLAYLGSQDFLDIENYGQIDGIAAKRSPGSLLKPFLYALSIDEGLIAPQSLLIDVPLFFSNFNPQNANKRYNGLIPAQIALQKSLNVPFVKLLQNYGYEKFFFALQEMLDFEDKNYQHYGLSLILGSKEFSPFEIAKLYLGLANYGAFGEIYYLKDSLKQPKKHLISQGSAYLTLQTLKELEREGELDYHKDKMTFSWKSGTSYGRKDAWAAGASPQYTIVVWVGNFTGKPNPNILGMKTAGSLLFEILEELPDNDIAFAIPESAFKEILIDKFSGYRLSEEMQQFAIPSEEILYPNDAKMLQVSPFYQKVFIANDKPVTSKDSAFIDASAQMILRLPINVLNYYKTQNIDIQKHLVSSQNRNTLKIIYPTNGLKIIQPKDFDGQKELIMRIANLTNQKVFWYLDHKLIFASTHSTQKIFLDSKPHTLSIIGEDGSIDSVKFNIE